MVAIICQGFVRVNSRETLKLFIPHLCDNIERLLNENPNIEKEEHLDAELLYNLQILAEIVDARSDLLNYADRLMNILDKTLHMTSLTGSQFAARMLDLIMSSLTYIVPTEFRSSPTSYDTHIKDFLSIRYLFFLDPLTFWKNLIRLLSATLGLVMTIALYSIFNIKWHCVE